MSDRREYMREYMRKRRARSDHVRPPGDTRRQEQIAVVRAGSSEADAIRHDLDLLAEKYGSRNAAIIAVVRAAAEKMRKQ